MRGADGSGRDGFIFRPAHEGKLAAGKGMVASSGWAGERNAAGWFSKDLPVTQWEQARARKQHAAFTRLYEDGKRYQTHVAECHAPPVYTRENYDQQLALSSWNPWSPAQLIANQRASRYPVPPIKRPSFLVDKHTGGVGGIICMQQLPSSRHDAQPRAAKADKVFPRDSLQVLTTPRRPTNYFTLPSLNLKHVKSNTSARSRGGSQTAREGADLQSAEKGSRTGAQTARERAKVALAAESIVNSLKKRLRSGLVTANSQQGARLGMTAEHTSLTAGSQAMRGDETAHGEIARDRSTMQLQMQLQA